jgi:hypothetical protein
MKRKTVRLTESELTRLIKTIVEDTKEKMDMDFEMPDRGGIDVMSAVRKASKMFEREFAEELSDREMMKLERLADKIDVERVMSKLERSQGEDLDDREEKASDKIEDIIKQVSESYLTEGKFDRIKSILARAGIFGGLGLMTVSGLAFVSQIPGHVDFEYLDFMIPAYYVLTTAEASSNLSRYDGIRFGYRSPNATNLEETYKLSRTEGFGREVKRRILLGTFVLSSGYYDAFYGKAQRVRRLIIEKTEEIFNQYDFILMPTAPGPAWPIGESLDDPIAMYLADIFTVHANLTGIPAISIPVQPTEEGLPLGIQFFANKERESALLGFVDSL